MTSANVNAVGETMTLEEVAARLSVSISVVRRSAQSGSLPAIKSGGRWFVLRRPFEELMRMGPLSAARRP